ncbi:MAG: transketolase [Candidatus Eiseniibacteriota bacterium]|nr:MAG: transketolase [Candidatus Eisenbacteria bacterium]
MPIVDSKTGKTIRKLSAGELVEAANLLRGYNLVSLAAAGSGHAGGTLSIMDIAAALYLNVARHDPKKPQWEDRDRIIWSTGHKAPSLYLCLGMSGYFDIEEVVTLRKLWSPFQGHPHWPKCPGIEASTGSLGQGLSIANGIALAARLDNRKHRVYCLMGDGEQQEGQIWEAVMEAGHYKLDNLCGIVDKNRLQIDGWVRDVMDIDPLADKYRSFGWNVIEIHGHCMEEILKAFEEAEAFKGKPTVIIAHTTKGKGVDFMEDVAGWHGKAPSYDQMLEGLTQLGLRQKLPVQKLMEKAKGYQKTVDKKLNAKMPRFSRDYFWNAGPRMKVEMAPTRKGFGCALADTGDDERVVCLGADISGSITISDFYTCDAKRENRFLSMGIAEQSATGVAAGLAKEGKLPVFGTYGVFASGRNLDQLRTTVCYGNFNVFIAGAHGGVSVGPDGATHQALEELFQMCGLPGMNVSVPCDSVETRKAGINLLFDIKGPKYLRFAREATPIVTTEETPYKFGEANVIRFRGESDNFIDAFETVLSSKYKNEREDLTIVACGPEVPEAMRAAYILKKEYGLETRIVNMHTVKPLDERTIVRACLETGILVTAEEHQVGGVGNLVAAVASQAREVYGMPVLMGMIGVKDRFGESGAPWELIKEFEVSAEHIAQKAKALYDFAKKKGLKKAVKTEKASSAKSKAARSRKKVASGIGRKGTGKKARRTKKARSARKTASGRKGRALRRARPAGRAKSEKKKAGTKPRGAGRQRAKARSGRRK